MEHFLINSSVCLFVLWLAYKLLLENTSWHFFKRYYLLGAVVISIAIPFIVVETIIIPVENAPIVAFATSEVITGITTQTIIEESTFQLDWTLILQVIYGLGVLIMLWRFIKNLRTFSIMGGDEVSSYQQYELVLRHMMTVPHSFLQRIFVSKKQYEGNLIPTEVLEHEKAHLDQRHSLDILLIEFLMIMFWFNPLFYILRYSIKLNHEFLADRAVIEKGTSTIEYQETLLQYTSQSHSATLANTFNFPIIKKRFHIMKTNTSQTSLILRSLALIPVLALLVMSCGKKEEIRKIDHNVDLSFSEDANMVYGIDIDGNIPEGTTFYNGVEYSYKINEDFTANLFYPDGEEVDTEANQLHLMIQFDADKEVEKLKQKEQETIEKIKSGLLKIKEITSTTTGRDIRELDYQELINYDFTGDSFTKSKIENVTELSFYIFPSMENILEIPVDQDAGYIQIFGNPFSFEKRNDSIIIKNKNGKIFNWKEAGFKIIEVGENKETLPPPPPPLKAQGYMKVDGKIYYYTTKDGDNNFYDRKGNIIDIKGKTVTQVDPNDLPPPPQPAPEYQDLVKYNVWARQINTKNKLARENGNNEYAIVKQKDVKKFKAIYDSFTETQMQNVEPWPNFPPPPPPPPVKLKSGATMKFLNTENEEELPQPPQSANKKDNSLGIKESSTNSNRSTDYLFTKVNEKRPLVSTYEETMNSQQKKDLDYRLTIMRASQRIEDLVEYEVESKKAGLDDAYTFIYEDPTVDVKVNENENGTLTIVFSKSKEKMSSKELQSAYSIVFKKYETSKI